ncbi:MAG: CPBP family intramembrane metalloprotease [Planctomycetes bacterium]|nr:CPBP family intramembrane metalloprotease [Planctomycetota bacterium]
MPKSKPEAGPPRPQAPGGYLHWSRDPAVGLFAVLPLWLLYEALRLTLAPHERNGAEAILAEALGLLGPQAVLILRGVFAFTVLVAAWSLHARAVPWAKVAAVSALEGTLYALLLGPLAAILATSSQRVLQAAAPGSAQGSLAADLVASLGAGIFEELFFRLILLSLLAYVAVRACAAFGVPRPLGVAFAVLASALLFALFHHLGPEAPPVHRGVFLFRTCAGLLLGILFVARGFGVAVYTHSIYDVVFYLTNR